MAIDFSKLNDPAWQAQVRKEREEREAKQEAHDNMLRAAVNTCAASEDSLSDKECSLVRSCRARLNTFQPLTEPQEKWLLDIAKRVRGDVHMNTVSPQTDEEWEAELVMLQAWQWDGRSMNEITERLEMINIHLPSKCKEWAHTVPAECRGKVFYVESSNPVNSEEETRRYAEILAVDEAGNALVCKTYYNSYTDDEAVENFVMPITEAKALVAEYKQRKVQQEMIAELAVEDFNEENDASPRPRM